MARIRLICSSCVSAVQTVCELVEFEGRLSSKGVIKTLRYVPVRWGAIGQKLPFELDFAHYLYGRVSTIRRDLIPSLVRFPERT